MQRETLELNLSKWKEPLDWKRLFGQTGPIEIEVGCGKGRFLLERAGENPSGNFLGLEYAKAYFRMIADRARRHNLTNIRVARAEAFDFFSRFVPDQSVSAFHLLYPDPWPKKRHHKRRLIRDEFLAELRRTLRREAFINIATDHRGYFDWMCEHFEEWKGTFVLEKRVVSDPKELSRLKGRTNYEIKYIEQGRPLHFITGYRTGF